MDKLPFAARNRQWWQQPGDAIEAPIRLASTAVIVKHSAAQSSGCGTASHQSRTALPCTAAHLAGVASSRAWLLLHTASSRSRAWTRCLAAGLQRRSAVRGLRRGVGCCHSGAGHLQGKQAARSSSCQWMPDCTPAGCRVGMQGGGVGRCECRGALVAAVVLCGTLLVHLRVAAAVLLWTRSSHAAEHFSGVPGRVSSMYCPCPVQHVERHAPLSCAGTASCAAPGWRCW